MICNMKIRGKKTRIEILMNNTIIRKGDLFRIITRFGDIKSDWIEAVMIGDLVTNYRLVSHSIRDDVVNEYRQFIRLCPFGPKSHSKYLGYEELQKFLSIPYTLNENDMIMHKKPIGEIIAIGMNDGNYFRFANVVIEPVIGSENDFPDQSIMRAEDHHLFVIVPG